jgi:hypothetical protein
MEKSLQLTPRFTQAVDYARQVHVSLRKGTQVPYMAHLLGVASIVLYPQRRCNKPGSLRWELDNFHSQTELTRQDSIWAADSSGTNRLLVAYSWRRAIAFVEEDLQRHADCWRDRILASYCAESAESAPRRADYDIRQQWWFHVRCLSGSFAAVRYGSFSSYSLLFFRPQH